MPKRISDVEQLLVTEAPKFREAITGAGTLKSLLDIRVTQALALFDQRSASDELEFTAYMPRHLPRVANEAVMSALLIHKASQDELAVVCKLTRDLIPPPVHPIDFARLLSSSYSALVAGKSVGHLAWFPETVLMHYPTDNDLRHLVAHVFDPFENFFSIHTFGGDDRQENTVGPVIHRGNVVADLGKIRDGV